MLDDFLIRAAFAGIGLSLATGPLGAFVVWRRMAYFGDATAHAAILGVSVALGFSVSIYAGTLLVALALALGVVGLGRKGHSADVVLGVLSHAMLAVGLVALSFVRGVRVDLNALLFGDILAVGQGDLVMIWGGALVVLALLVWRWSALITATISPDLARSEGISAEREQLILSIGVAVTVAVAMKVVGALLIAAMLIIPAAAARPLARSPEAMAVLATVAGALATVIGLALSLWQDTPAGPSIVVAAGALFTLGLFVRRA